LLLDALEYDDVGVRRDADRQDQAGDPRKRQRDRYQLDQRVEHDRVGEERKAGDRSQQPVEQEQEQQHHDESDGARQQSLAQRLLAERGGDLRLVDQLEVDRQRAALEQLGEVLRGRDREAARYLGPRAPVDAVGVLLEVDVG